MAHLRFFWFHTFVMAKYIMPCLRLCCNLASCLRSIFPRERFQLVWCEATHAGQEISTTTFGNWKLNFIKVSLHLNQWMYLCFGRYYKQIRIIQMTSIKTQVQSKIDTAGSTHILPKTSFKAVPRFNTVYCSLRGLLSKSRLWERCCVLLGGNVV